MKRALWIVIAAAVAVVLFNISRFWYLSLWPRSGLIGIEALRTQGGLLGQWVRGTDFAPFELLIWAVGAFLVLTILQKLYDLLNPPPE